MFIEGNAAILDALRFFGQGISRAIFQLSGNIFSLYIYDTDMVLF